MKKDYHLIESGSNTVINDDGGSSPSAISTEETVKCSYSKCLHESRNILKSDAFYENNKPYHKDCCKTKNQIKEIIQLFVDYIDPNPAYTQLNHVIRDIVFKKNIGSDRLLFGLQYYIDHHLSLNYPQGLYYVIKNKDVDREYNKRAINNLRTPSMEVTEDSNLVFKHTPIKQVGFDSILRR